MKKLLFLFMLPALGFSQNFVFIGENSYPSTDVYEFENTVQSYQLPVSVSFIKSNEGILISLNQLEPRWDHQQTPSLRRGLCFFNRGAYFQIFCQNIGLFI